MKLKALYNEMLKQNNLPSGTHDIEEKQMKSKTKNIVKSQKSKHKSSYEF